MRSRAATACAGQSPPPLTTLILNGSMQYNRPLACIPEVLKAELEAVVRAAEDTVDTDGRNTEKARPETQTQIPLE